MQEKKEPSEAMSSKKMEFSERGANKTSREECQDRDKTDIRRWW